MFHVITHHGTEGVEGSYGYTEIWQENPPRATQTLSVQGPYQTMVEAERARDEIEKLLFRARTQLDAARGSIPDR